jgi:hypothetical protein
MPTIRPPHASPVTGLSLVRYLPGKPTRCRIPGGRGGGNGTSLAATAFAGAPSLRVVVSASPASRVRQGLQEGFAERFGTPPGYDLGPSGREFKSLWARQFFRRG